MAWKQATGSSKTDVVTVLETLLRTRELTVEHGEIIWQALRKFMANKTDFADCLVERCAHAAVARTQRPSTSTRSRQRA